MPVPRLVHYIVLAAALGAVVALGLTLTASLPATLEAMARFPWRLAPLVIVATLTSYALRFLKWHFYIRRLAIPLPGRQSILVFLAGFTMSITPGKFGEVLKALLVRSLVGTEIGRTASVVMAERLTDVAGLLILSGFGASALPHGFLLLGSLTTLVSVAVVLLRAPAVTRLARRMVPRRLARFTEPLRLFVGSSRTLLAPSVLAFTAVLSAAAWLFECLAFHVILRGLEAPASLQAATFVYAFASLAGAVSMLPGGLGIAEGSLTGLLVGLGTALPQAAAATLLVRAATLWLAVSLGVTTLLTAFRGGPAKLGEPAS